MGAPDTLPDWPAEQCDEQAIAEFVVASLASVNAGALLWSGWEAPTGIVFAGPIPPHAMPPKAGIQQFQVLTPGLHPAEEWIPAFAGMTCEVW